MQKNTLSRPLKKKVPQHPTTLSLFFDALFNTVIGVVTVLIIYTIFTQFGSYFIPESSESTSPLVYENHTTHTIHSIEDSSLRGFASTGLETLKNIVHHDLSADIQAISSNIMTHHPFQEESIEERPLLPACDDPIWCSIPMPSISSYKFFHPPTDEYRWKLAQLQAVSGELVLLKEISKVFPNPFDFLDGDRSFRRLHNLIDIFIDEKSGLGALTPKFFKNQDGRRLQESESPLFFSSVSSSSSIENSDKIVKLSENNGSFPWEIERRRVVPVPYNYRYSKRSPIVQLGYAAFRKDYNEYFSGNREGGTFISRNNFISQWQKVKDNIDIPFITVCTLNENWGFLSTMIPNRTALWGNCCEKKKDRAIYEFLDHPKTLMLAVNQHSNLSHPKVITLPRGIPLTWEKTAWIVWDLIRYSIENIKKQKLLFASSSSWGPRPQIIRCVSSKISVEDFEGHDQTPHKEMKKTKVNRRRYYEKIASARFGLSLPGFGYDTFRMWELLTMGSIVVIERGIGFDRTLWKLPALLLDDFAEITPELLRSAYLEALYHVKEFEFERLTQSWWWTVFANVSKSMSIEPLLEKFPMEAEEVNFARPLVPYECGKTRSCPPGIKNTPRRSC